MRLLSVVGWCGKRPSRESNPTYDHQGGGAGRSAAPVESDVDGFGVYEPFGFEAFAQGV